MRACMRARARVFVCVCVLAEVCFDWFVSFVIGYVL